MHSQVFLRRGVLLGVVTTAALAALLPARAQVGEPKPAPAPQTSSATPACAVSAAQVRLNQPLPRLARRLANGMAIKIVALGSSSTSGAGASSSAASYPSRLALRLSRPAGRNNAPSKTPPQPACASEPPSLPHLNDFMNVASRHVDRDRTAVRRALPAIWRAADHREAR